MHLHLVTLHVKPSPQSVPLAAAFLQANLAAHGPLQQELQISKSDFMCGTSVESMVAAISSVSADLVGFSLYLWNRAEVTLLARHLHDRHPHLQLLVGGPEATADPTGVMSAAPFDFLVLGEGEGATADLLLRLLNNKHLDDLKGIVRREGGEIHVSSPAPLLNLENLPSPWLTGLLDGYIPHGVLWQLSRGCSFACEFCFDGMGSNAVRRFPLSRISAELDYLVRHGVRQIFVLDSTFNQDLLRAKAILKMIREKAPRVHFHFEIRHEFLDKESAELFSSLPCSLQIGLQSASPKVLEQVGRTFQPELFSRKIALLNQSGATFGFDLIIGLPGDSLAEFKKSLNFALRHYPNQLDIFPLALLPGTPLGNKTESLQLKYLDHSPYTIISTPTFPPEDLKAACELALACDIFYTRGKAVAWFNSVAGGLKLSPAEVLVFFAEWLAETRGEQPDSADHPDHTIWTWQREFLSTIFHRKKLAPLLPMALDLVDYHYHHSAVVLSPPSKPLKPKEIKGIDLLTHPLRRNDACRLAQFHYDIEELINTGEPQIAQATRQLSATGSFALLYRIRGEVCTEMLPEGYFQLLKGLDGRRPAGKIAETLGIGHMDARKFLQTALAEGILTTT